MAPRLALNSNFLVWDHAFAGSGDSRLAVLVIVLLFAALGTLRCEGRRAAGASAPRRWTWAVVPLLLCIATPVAGSSGCENTCLTCYALGSCYSNAGASDGYCDDGGPGSQYSLCELGTDCADCGSRVMPPPPPPSPPPPSPPPGYSYVAPGFCGTVDYTVNELMTDAPSMYTTYQTSPSSTDTYGWYTSSSLGTGMCNIRSVENCSAICIAVSGCAYFSTSTTASCYACFLYKTCPNQSTSGAGSGNQYAVFYQLRDTGRRLDSQVPDQVTLDFESASTPGVSTGSGDGTSTSDVVAPCPFQRKSGSSSATLNTGPTSVYSGSHVLSLRLRQS